MTIAQPLSIPAKPLSRRPLISTLLALAVAAAGLTTVVSAANRFAVVGVHNATHVTIRLQHKWGDGSWAADVLPPGGRKW